MTKTFLTHLKSLAYALIVKQFGNILKIVAGIALGAWLF